MVERVVVASDKFKGSLSAIDVTARVAAGLALAGFGGKGMAEYLLTPAHERRVQAILSDIAPGGGSGDEQYALPADVELVFIMAGRLEITIDEELVILEEGDAFTFTASARHAFRAVDESGPTRVLWVVSPALPDTTRYPR